jgi:hypothetical protein
MDIRVDTGNLKGPLKTNKRPLLFHQLDLEISCAMPWFAFLQGTLRSRLRNVCSPWILSRESEALLENGCVSHSALGVLVATGSL